MTRSSPAASIDFETRSAVDLKKAGLHRYFEDPTTEILCLAWRIGDGPVHSWRPGEPNPEPLWEHVKAGRLVIAHNNAFDRTAWNTKLLGAPPLSIEQCDCTMARGAVMALPQSLDQLGKALKAPISKDPVGHRLMLKMCKPPFRDDPEKLAALADYCVQDVEAERAIDKLVPLLSKSERRIWLLDQTINDRGIQIDVPLARKAHAVVALAAEQAHRRMRELTKGAVSKTSEVAKIVRWLRERGLPVESIAKAGIEEIEACAALFDDPVAAEVLALRREAAKASTAKYTAILNSVCDDGRVRGSLRYHGASTGRWAGSGIQPHNFPRVRSPDAVLTTLDILRRQKNTADLTDMIRDEVGEPLAALSQCLRAMLIAAPKHRLIGGDYANIEGRVNAWLAGEAWKTTAFADYDKGVGDDLYSLAYARAFDVPVDKITGDFRQIGKVMELSMGFGGGWRAFEKMGANYGISVGEKQGEELKRAWREAHPCITQSWWDLQDAALTAVQHPGETVSVLDGYVKYRTMHGMLWCKLPSGRALVYAAPRVQMSEPTEERPTSRPQVLFDGVDSLTKRWGTHYLYGGLQCENIVQAVARDILAEGMLRLEASSYPLVLTIHDENISEVPDGHGSPAEFAALMEVLPDWAEGLPVAVKAWEDKRYVK